MKTKTRYYVEITNDDEDAPYILQSKWYDTKKEALGFADSIEFLEDNYRCHLMSAVWYTDENGDETYDDIEIVKTFRK